MWTKVTDFNEDTDISTSAEGIYRKHSESGELILKWIISIDINWGSCPNVKTSFIGGESEAHSQYEVTPEEGLQKSVEREKSNWWHQVTWSRYVPLNLGWVSSTISCSFQPIV